MRGRRLPTALQLGYGLGDTGIVHVLDAQRLQQLTELRLVQVRARRYVLTVSLVLAASGGLTAADGARTAR
jgi:outer membrane protein TolC